MFAKKTFSQRLELLGVVRDRTNTNRFFTGIYCKRAVSMGFRPLDGGWDRKAE